MTIWAHTLVKNEERYLWYALMSVIGYVDKILIWDTGSSDATVKIIRWIKEKYPQKVDFKEIGEVNPQEVTQARQGMLGETKSEWCLILDGDEVWWEDSIKKVTEEIRKRGDVIESIVVKTINLVGDIYHYQEEAAGRYVFAGKRGHFNLRAFSTKIPGLHAEGVYPREYYGDGKGEPIQEKIKGLHFLDVSYLHFTHLKRSSSLAKTGRERKFKYEIGKSFPFDFYYPEVFFKRRPDVAVSAWEKMNSGYLARALLQTPLKRVKRRLIYGKAG